MPTFPPPPLRFRTVGVPQYGSKASISAGAFPSGSRVKRAPSIPRPALGLLAPSRTPRLPDPPELRCLAPRGNPEGSSPQDAPLTPGVLGSGRVILSQPSSPIRSHPPVSQARGDFTGSPLIRPAFAVRERLGDPRDVPSFPGRAVPACRGPYAGGLAPPSRCPGVAIAGFLALGPSRHPHARLCQRYPAGPLTALHPSLYATARRFASPSGLAPTPGAEGSLCLLRTLSPSLLPAGLAADG